MSGQVSEFLISSSLLQGKILKKPDFKDSIYQVDTVLFYSLSNGIIIKSDSAKRKLYFLVMTPVIKSADIYPLYNVINLGWIRDEVNYKVSVPQIAYFISDRDELEIASLNKAQCVLKQGFQL